MDKSKDLKARQINSIVYLVNVMKIPIILISLSMVLVCIEQTYILAWCNEGVAQYLWTCVWWLEKMAAHRKNCPKKIPSEVFRTNGEGSQFVHSTRPIAKFIFQTSSKFPVICVALTMIAVRVANMMHDWNKSDQTTVFNPPWK